MGGMLGIHRKEDIYKIGIISTDKLG